MLLHSLAEDEAKRLCGGSKPDLQLEPRTLYLKPLQNICSRMHFLMSLKVNMLKSKYILWQKLFILI